jgi:hypothetical protein
MQKINDLLYSPEFWFVSVFVGVTVNIISSLIISNAKKIRPSLVWADVIVYGHFVVSYSLVLITTYYGQTLITDRYPIDTYVSIMNLCFGFILCLGPLMLLKGLFEDNVGVHILHSASVAIIYCLVLFELIRGPINMERGMQLLLVLITLTACTSLIILITATITKFILNGINLLRQAILRR